MSEAGREGRAEPRREGVNAKGKVRQAHEVGAGDDRQTQGLLLRVTPYPQHSTGPTHHLPSITSQYV